MRHLLLAGAALCAPLLLGTPARSQTTTVVSGYACPAGQTVLNVGNNRPNVETQDGLLCVQDPNAATSSAAQLADLDSMTSSLTALKNASAYIPPVASPNGACKVISATPVSFYEASGNVNAASYIFILNRASDTGDGAVVAGDLIVAPITAGAAGFWSVATIQPVRASVGVTICVSSTLYSSGVLTKTNLTSTNATNNAIVGIAQ